MVNESLAGQDGLRWLYLDTHIWSHVLRPADRAARREFVDVVRSAGLQLGWSPENLLEVLRTSDASRRQAIAEVMAELSGDEGCLVSGQPWFGDELAHALRRDHPEWMPTWRPPFDQWLHAWRRRLWETVRGTRRRTIGRREREALTLDAAIHARLRNREYVKNRAGVLAGHDAAEIVRLIKTHPGVGKIVIPVQPDAPVRISVSEFRVCTKIALIREMLPAFEKRLTDVRGELVRQLSRTCDSQCFATWVWEGLRDEDVPSYRVQIAVGLGQALRAHRPSNADDRLHAEYLSRVTLLVTSDRGLRDALAHPSVRPWIPQRWAFLDQPRASSLPTLMTLVQARRGNM